MQQFKFRRETHTLEGLLFPGENIDDIVASEEIFRGKYHNFLDSEVEKHGPNYAYNLVFVHGWADLRGVDSVNKAFAHNLALELDNYNIQNETNLKLNLVLVGKDYSEANPNDVREYFSNDNLSRTLDVHLIEVDPEKRVTVKLAPSDTLEEYLEVSEYVASSAWDGELGLKNILSNNPGRTLVIGSNVDLSIYSQLTGGYKLLFDKVQEYKEDSGQWLRTVFDLHDALENGGPVWQDHINSGEELNKRLLTQGSWGKPLFVEALTPEFEGMVQNFVTYFKNNTDYFLTINALNRHALSDIPIVRVNPLPQALANVEALVDMDLNRIINIPEPSLQTQDSGRRRIGLTQRNLDNLTQQGYDEPEQKVIIDAFENDVQRYFVEQDLTFDSDKGMVFYFANPDIRKNIPTFVLHSELMGYNGVVTLTGYKPESGTLDGFVNYIVQNFVKDFEFNVSFGYGWNSETKKGSITSNDDQRIISEDELEWSRVDVLRMLSVMNSDEKDREGKIYGNNLTAVQEGFGGPFLECTLTGSPFVHFNMDPFLNSYFKESLGIDLKNTEYTDLNVNRDVLANAKTQFRDEVVTYIRETIDGYESGSLDEMKQNGMYDHFMDLMINDNGQTQFTQMDLASQLSFVLYAKENPQEVSEAHRDYVSQLQFNTNAIEYDRDHLKISSSTSGLSMAALFMGELDEVSKNRLEYGPKQIDYAVKEFAQHSPPPSI
jgi:hypothetical protein